MDDDILNSFLNNLFTFLVGQEPNSINDTKIFRKHNNKLDKSGEISLPLNLSGWAKYTQNSPNERKKIDDYIEKFSNNLLKETCFNDLINDTKSWDTIYIDKVEVNNNKLNIFLNRSNTFKKVISTILHGQDTYGTSELKIKPVNIKTDNDDENNGDLTSLRLRLIKNVTVNVLKNCGCHVDGSESDTESIYFTIKSESKCTSKKIVCGVVISNKFGKKNTNLSAEEFYKKRTVDMQLMAQHKYGLRVNSEPGWADFFKQLGNAAVIIDLLHVKPSRPVIVNEDNSVSTCSKGASFILYNCARLAKMFKKFDELVATGQIPSMPAVDDVDFSLLNQPEEWELLYVHLMQYPSIVKSCVADILECRLNTHNLCVFLDSMCSTFSVYYRRVRVLTEPRPHLFPVMHAKLYLLKAIQQVLHHALALLDIPPIKQM